MQHLLLGGLLSKRIPSDFKDAFQNELPVVFGTYIRHRIGKSHVFGRFPHADGSCIRVLHMHSKRLVVKTRKVGVVALPPLRSIDHLLVEKIMCMPEISTVDIRNFGSNFQSCDSQSPIGWGFDG